MILVAKIGKLFQYRIIWSNSVIVFVGDKPSKYNKDPKVPFIGARCEKRLMEWIKYLNVSDYDIINRSDTALFLAYKVVIDMHQYPVVAFGNNASKALGSIKHFKLPHPSGLNRQVNDKEFIKSKLNECKKWLNENENFSFEASMTKMVGFSSWLP